MHPNGDSKYPDLLIGDAIPECDCTTRRMGNCLRCCAAGPSCCNCIDCHEKGSFSRFELVRFSVGRLTVKPEDNQPHWNMFDMPTVNPMSENLVVPLPNYDGSDVVLFLDETSQNLRFISGPFSLSNSRHRGKLGVDTTSGATRIHD